MLNVLKNRLNARYSTKIFDPKGKIDPSKIEILLNTLHLAPTSINSQAWHLFVIKNTELKNKLATAAIEMNQEKYRDCEYLFVFCAKTTFKAKDLLEIEELTSKIRNCPINNERLKGLSRYVESMDTERCSQWLIRQVYLVFGQFLTSAALLEIDNCPIEGFEKQQMDQLLNLKELGLRSVATAAVGVRSNLDPNTIEKSPKIRFEPSKMITQLK